MTVSELVRCYNLKRITTLYKNLHSLLIRLTRLQTNESEKENNEKIQITAVDSKKLKTVFVSKQNTVLLFSHMTQGHRKKMQYCNTIQQMSSIIMKSKSESEKF